MRSNPMHNGAPKLRRMILISIVGRQMYGLNPGKPVLRPKSCGDPSCGRCDGVNRGRGVGNKLKPLRQLQRWAMPEQEPARNLG